MSGTFVMMMAAGGVAEQPIDGQTGVWLKSGGVTISSGMKMIGAVVSNGQTQYIYSRGVAQSCLFLQSSTQSVFLGGVASGCAYVDRYPVVARAYGGTIVGGSVGNGATVSATSGAIVRDMDVTVSLSILSGFGSNIRGSNGCTVVAGDYTGNASGVIDGLTISGGRLIVAWTGQVTNATVVGSAQIFQHGLATYVDATINGGSMLISSNYLSGYYRDPAIGGFVNMSWYVGTMTSCGFGSGQIMQGATATNIDIYSKCDYQVRGILSGATVESGGTLTISSAGTASNLTVAESGRLYVSNGGTAVSGTISGTSALADVSSGGAASSITIQSGGRVNVWTGGALTDVATVSGTLVLYGGSANGITHNGGTFLLQAGGAFASGVVTYAGAMTVASDGSIYSLTVSGNKSPQISGYCSGATVAPDGLLQAMPGGTIAAVTVESGGSLYVRSDGSALAVVSNTGAVVSVFAGGYIEYA